MAPGRGSSVPSRVITLRRSSPSVRKHRHRQIPPAEQHGPGHRCRSEPLPNVVDRLVERSRSMPSNGNASCTLRASSRFATETPMSVRPRRSIDRRRRPSRARAAVKIVSVCAVRARQRVRAGRAREVVEAQSEHDRAATRSAARRRRATRSTSATRTASSSCRRPAARGRARAASRSSRGAGRRAPAADHGCARARAGAGPTPRRASRPAPARAGARPRRRSRCRVGAASPRSCGPTPHSRSTGSGWRNSSSRSGGTTSRPSGLATPLATLARNLVRATPTVIGRPTCSSTSRRSRTAISVGVPDAAPQPADVEERLVDRQALDERRRVARTRRTPPCSPRSTPTCAAPRRPRAGTAGAPRVRPSRCARRTPSPRSSPRARRPRRR